MIPSEDISALLTKAEKQSTGDKKSEASDLGQSISSKTSISDPIKAA